MDELNPNENNMEDISRENNSSAESVSADSAPADNTPAESSAQPQTSGSDIIDIIDGIDTSKLNNGTPNVNNAAQNSDPFAEKNYNMGAFHTPPRPQQYYRGYDPNAYRTNSYGYDPNAYNPNPGGYNSSAYNPNPGGYNSNAYDPNRRGYDPNAYNPDPNGYNSNAYDPNPNGYAPNPGGYNNAYNPYPNGYAPNGMNGPAPAPAKKKHMSKGALAAVIISISAMFVLIVIVLAFSSVNETYDELTADTQTETNVSDSVTEDSGSERTGDVSVNITIQPKPSLESKYYQDEETGLLTVEGVAKRVSPSVVDVMVFRDTSLYPYSTGSGIIISEDGYIVTNAHVLTDVNAGLKVVLENGEEYKAEIVGQDSRTDIAVIKIEAEGLTAADLGDSDQLELGEMVVAIGNAGGYSGTLTVGYVSGLNREVKTSTDGDSMTCIQTDAAMSPGVSGGALINMYGQVVGITSSKYKSTVLDEGIGFAITTQFAKPIIEDIISQGYISGRVRVGITYTIVTDDMAEAYGIKKGIIIQSVDESCDIAKTDLQAGDIMTELNGQEVYSAQTIKKALEGCEPGDIISAHIYRKGVTEDEDEEFDITFELMQDTTLS
ncbi:MAG: trypsin-like peptidase domain-containing protein [Oscillospiraceae bacterium]|nr:trypsin-like peptidase domain-containing protein [Oscillospiraceae bacterium]MDY2848189.1 trypsin-like peptidase domain-containing protein [Oscillospiraceae bacterium]